MAVAASPYLTIEEAAAYLRIDHKTLRRHVMAQIPPLEIGRRRFYTTEMLDAWHDLAKGGNSASPAGPATRTLSGSRSKRGGLGRSPRAREIREKLLSKQPASTPPSSPPDPSPIADESPPPSKPTS